MGRAPCHEMVRAIYKGRLCLGGFHLPVKVYAAVQDRDVHFRLLHEQDGVPLKQRLIDPSTDEPVENEEVQRAYRTAQGPYVVLRDEEREELEPGASRDLGVLRFVEFQRLNHQWYVRPYYLGPDGSADKYFALVEVLSKDGLEGIVRWVMRKKEYRGALRAYRGYLVLIALRHAGEIVDAGQLPALSGRKLEPKERQMASQLVDMLSGPFEPEAYEDEYRQRLAEFLQKKARGERVRLHAPKRKLRKDHSLSQALEASVKREKEKKVA